MLGAQCRSITPLGTSFPLILSTSTFSSFEMLPEVFDNILVCFLWFPWQPYIFIKWNYFYNSERVPIKPVKIDEIPPSGLGRRYW